MGWKCSFSTLLQLVEAFNSVEYCILLKMLGDSTELLWQTYSLCEGRWLPVTVTCHWVWDETRIVLSLSLFLLMIDHLLWRLKEANEGVIIEDISVDSLAHADDLCSLTRDPHSERQAAIISDFLTENFLQLNTKTVYTHMGFLQEHLNRCVFCTLRTNYCLQVFGYKVDSKSNSNKSYHREYCQGPQNILLLWEYFKVNWTNFHLILLLKRLWCE